MSRFLATFLAAAAISVLTHSAGHAEGLVFKLPADGAWARYAVDGKAIGDEGQVRVSVAGSALFSSVGRSTVDGKECRWIEVETTVKFTRDDREAEFTEIFKLLIPEASLSRGHNPREHVLKAYKKERQGTIRELDLDGTGRREVESLDEIFHGTLPMVETLGEKTIDCKLGKLDCRGEKGDDGADFTTETWLNEKAPFGVVRYSYQKRRRGMSFTLEDAGAGAESKLPDSN